jgi:4-aminobutyrate aminotransferase-like enzyme
MSKSKNNQSDKEGYKEGLHTGLKRGYDKGLKDALIVCQTLLSENGVHMADKEFHSQYQVMLDEGEIKGIYDN